MDAKDFIFKDDKEIVNGDWSVSFSDTQHIEHILRAEKGNFYQFPATGVGIEKYQNGSVRPGVLEKLISDELRADNYSISEIKVAFEQSEMQTTIRATRIK